jgi:antibiotic biosynthesis monooxygenase (ABM) superfamily enzyme
MFPEHILTVRATVEPAHEEEFNRWYQQEHIPDVLKIVPGCLGAARYRVLDGDRSHQYLGVQIRERSGAQECAPGQRD